MAVRNSTKGFFLEEKKIHEHLGRKSIECTNSEWCTVAIGWLVTTLVLFKSVNA